MKFSCEKYVLQNAGNVTSRATASKSPIPALEGILIEAGNGVKLTGYDLKKGIYTSIEADVAEMGSVILEARLFNEILRRMPDGIITVSADEKYNVNVRCGKSEFNIIGIAPDDYPEMPKVDEQRKIDIPQKYLKSMINQTIFAVSNNDARPVYTGTLFEVSGDSLTMVAIDGYRLAKRTEQLENAAYEDASFIVPGSALSDVEKICADEDELVSISVGSKHISFMIGNTVLVSRRLEGEFLNYRKSIPESFKITLKLERSEFISAIDRVSLIASEKNTNPVRMTVDDGVINCVCITPRGKAEDICSCEGNGNKLEIGFNARYLLDAFKAAGKDTLLFCMNTPYSPAVVKAEDGTENFTYMILPVRLRAE